MCVCVCVCVCNSRDWRLSDCVTLAKILYVVVDDPPDGSNSRRKNLSL